MSHFFTWQGSLDPNLSLRAGTALGQKVLTYGDLCRWAALQKWRLQNEPDLSGQPGPTEDRADPPWKPDRDPSCLGRCPQQQRWDTGSQGWNSGRPGWEVSGSGWTDVQCQGSSAWWEAVAALYTMPGVTLGSWVNTTPTYGPRWPWGCGESPKRTQGFKCLLSTDFPFICGKSIHVSWLLFFAF